jgi:hypothetical protein
MIVLKVEQATRDWQSKQDKYAEIQRRKGEESEAKEHMLVIDIYIFVYFGSKDLCCSKCHIIVLHFYFVVLSFT